MRVLAQPPARASHRERGFTLMELLVVMALLALMLAMVLPNLGALVPSARLQGSGNQILRRLDWVRSEARIQGKRMSIEFDLEKARWRIVYPPEQRLTRDQDVSTLEEHPDDWSALDTDVEFAGAGDGKNGLTHRGIYRLIFDEYGFTGDQLVALKLHSDPQMVWAMSIHGLSGRVTVTDSERGELPTLQIVNEGAF